MVANTCEKGVGFDHDPRKIQDPCFRNGYVWPLMDHARHSLGLSFWRYLSRLALLLKKVSFIFCFRGHSVATDRDTKTWPNKISVPSRRHYIL